MSTTLVTGANGFVGSHMIPALVDAGHRVVALVRDDDGAAQVLRRLTPAQREQVETRHGDVTEPDTLPPAIAGVDGILHLAAIPRDWDGGASLRLVNTEGTRNVLRAASDAVSGGSSTWARSASPMTRTCTSRARRRRAMALVRESGLDWTILSPSLLFGPRDGFFNILADLVRMSPGIVPITGKGDARFQPLAITDLAPVRPSSRSPIRAPSVASCPLGGPRVWTYREIMAEVLRGMGKRRLMVPMPVALIRLVAGVCGEASPPVSRCHRPAAPAQARQRRPPRQRDGRLRLRPAAHGGRPHPSPAPAQGPGAGRRLSRMPRLSRAPREDPLPSATWASSKPCASWPSGSPGSLVVVLISFGTAGVVATMSQPPGSAGPSRADVGRRCGHGARPGRRDRGSPGALGPGRCAGRHGPSGTQPGRGGRR